MGVRQEPACTKVSEPGGQAEDAGKPLKGHSLVEPQSLKIRIPSQEALQHRQVDWTLQAGDAERDQRGGGLWEVAEPVPAPVLHVILL